MLLLFTVPLTSCEVRTATDVLAEVCGDCENMPVSTVYFDGKYDENKMPAEYWELLYGFGRPEEVLSDYAVVIGSAPAVFEIHVLCAKVGCEREVIGLLENRLAMLRSNGMEDYEPSAFYRVIDNAKIERIGEHFVLKLF